MSDDNILKLKQHIDNIVLLSTEAWADLENIIYISEIKNGDFFVIEGGRATSEAYVIKGIMRGFYRSFDGEEIKVAFYNENSVLPSLYTRSKNNSSNLNIQALSDTAVGEFNAEQFTSLRYRHGSLMTYGNIIVEREQEYKTEREILLLTKSAEERYSVFREMYPGLEIT